MKEITEDYCDFETAKLLKEKGFNWDESPFYSEQDRDEWRQNNNYAIPNVLYDRDLPFDSETITLIAPHVSLQMAMKWLREKHDIFITILQTEHTTVTMEQKYFFYRIQKNRRSVGVFTDTFMKPEQACEAAIKYCLEKLV